MPPKGSGTPDRLGLVADLRRAGTGRGPCPRSRGRPRASRATPGSRVSGSCSLVAAVCSAGRPHRRWLVAAAVGAVGRRCRPRRRPRSWMPSLAHVRFPSPGRVPRIPAGSSGAATLTIVLGDFRAGGRCRLCSPLRRACVDLSHRSAPQADRLHRRTVMRHVPDRRRRRRPGRWRPRRARRGRAEKHEEGEVGPALQRQGPDGLEGLPQGHRQVEGRGRRSCRHRATPATCSASAATTRTSASASRPRSTTRATAASTSAPSSRPASPPATRRRSTPRTATRSRPAASTPTTARRT